MEFLPIIILFEVNNFQVIFYFLDVVEKDTWLFVMVPSWDWKGRCCPNRCSLNGTN